MLRVVLITNVQESVSQKEFTGQAWKNCFETGMILWFQRAGCAEREFAKSMRFEPASAVVINKLAGFVLIPINNYPHD